MALANNLFSLDLKKFSDWLGLDFVKPYEGKTNKIRKELVLAILEQAPDEWYSRDWVTVCQNLIWISSLSSTEQLNLAKEIGQNQDMKDQLITGFGNYPTQVLRHSTPAQENLNSTESVQKPQQSQSNLQLHSALAMLLDKASKKP